MSESEAMLYGEQKRREVRNELEEEAEEWRKEQLDEAQRLIASGRERVAIIPVVRLVDAYGLMGRTAERTEKKLEGLLEEMGADDLADIEKYNESARPLRRVPGLVKRVIDRNAEVTVKDGANGGTRGLQARWDIAPEKYMTALKMLNEERGDRFWEAEALRRFREMQGVETEHIELMVDALEEVAVYERDVPRTLEDTYHVDADEFAESPLQELYEKRRRQDRDVKVIVTARDSETGTGKTSLAVRLCQLWDVHGWNAEEKATHDPNTYTDAYSTLPEGSALLLDEGGQAFDSRRSMSTSNVEASQDWQMGRYRQVYTILTLPSVSMLDKRMKELADIRINVTRRGHARVYRLKVDDFDGGTFSEHLCNVEWDAIDDDPEYQAVEASKEERMEGDGDDEEPEEERVDEKELRREARNDTIRELVENGMTQTEVAEHLELSRSMVSRIVAEDSQ